MENNLNYNKYPKYAKYVTVFFIFALAVAIFYGNTFGNGYIHDDHGQVESNTYIQSLKYAPKVITGCIWESANGSCKGSLYYRPMQSLSYLLTYQFSGEPWIFHLVNLIYFVISVFLVFVLIELLTKNFTIAFLSASIFLIHPLNTEVVNWIASVPELLYLIFSILAVIFYFLYREKQNSKYLIGVYISYFLGIMSKEPAVFTPIIFLALDIVYFKKSISEFFYWKKIKPYVICALIFAVYVGLRFWILGGLGTNPSSGQTIVQHLYTFAALFADYVKKIFWPYPLILFYTFNPSYNFLNIQFLTAALILLAYGGLCFWAWKKQWRVIFISLVWFLIFLFPSLVFVSSIGENLFAERHVFASTVGFAVIIATLLYQIFKQGKLGRTSVAVLMIVATVVSFTVVYNRNKLWNNDLAIYVDTLKHSPDANLIRYNLAIFYRDDNKIDLAKQELQKIIGQGSWIGLYKAYNNLGNIYQSENSYQEALKYFNLSLKENPTHKKALNNVGMIYLEQGEVLRSLTYFCKAILIDQSFETVEKNYDSVVSAIQNLENDKLNALYENITQKGVFQPSPSKDTMSLTSKNCSSEQCSLVFSGKFKTGEFIFSFLILGKTSGERIVKPTSTKFNPATNEITLTVSPQLKDTDIKFVFPTCEAIYYSADVSARGPVDLDNLF